MAREALSNYIRSFNAKAMVWDRDGLDTDASTTVYRDGLHRAHAKEIKADNPTHYWKFNEAASPIIDYGSGGKNLTEAGSPAYQQTGAEGLADAVVGDGSTDYFTSSLVFNPSIFTWECIVNATSSNDAIFDGRDANNDGLYIQTAASTTTFFCSATDMVTTTNILGAFHHLALTADGTNLRLFVNGIQEDSTTSFSAQLDVTASAEIMRNRLSSAKFMAGTMQHMALWTSTALSNQRVLDHAISALRLTDADLQGDPSLNPKSGYKMLALDGTGDYASIGSKAWQHFSDNKFTIIARINRDALGAEAIFGKWVEAGNSRVFLLGIDSSNQLELQVSNDGNAPSSVVSTPTISTRDQVVAVTYDGGTVKMYRDGAELATTNSTDTTIVDKAAAIHIGAADDASLMTGDEGPVVLINKVLTRQEIIQATQRFNTPPLRDRRTAGVIRNRNRFAQ